MRKRLAGLIILLAITFTACDAVMPSPPNTITNTPAAVPSLDLSVTNAEPTPVPQSIIDQADAEYLLLTNIYTRAASSVVNIEVSATDSRTGETEIRNGSGFVYDLAGNIVTNAHVVKDANQITVTFHDGFVTEAELGGLDSFSDLAVIVVNTGVERLRPLELGDSNTARVGNRAIAIGNPFGFTTSMSTGIISGIGRTLRSAELVDANSIPGFQNPSIIQIDTPINPGSSGGPLLNSSGEVIGVTTAIRSGSGVFEGIGFAVPSNTVKRIIPELIEAGRVDYSWIGISVLPEDNGFGVAGLFEILDLPVSSGVLVRGITIDSPAHKAGLRPGIRAVELRGQTVCAGGDIIVAVNNQRVQNMDELVSLMVMQTRPNETVNLLVVRDNETLEIPLTLEKRPIFGGNDVIDCVTPDG